VLDEPVDPESACIRVLVDVVGDHVAEDDIAVLVARVDVPDAEIPVSE
jgi:hypothetical protein